MKFARRDRYPSQSEIIGARRRGAELTAKALLEIARSYAVNHSNVSARMLDRQRRAVPHLIAASRPRADFYKRIQFRLLVD